MYMLASLSNKHNYCFKPTTLPPLRSGRTAA